MSVACTEIWYRNCDWFVEVGGHQLVPTANKVRFFFFLPAPGAPFGGSVSWGVGPLAGVVALVAVGAGVAEERIPSDSGGTLSPSLTGAEEEKDIFE